jgi:long-chain fatty acid transport protein
MKLKALTSAIVLATLPMTGVFAAAMDRSGQSIGAFLQPGNYFEAGISVLDPSVKGKEAGDYQELGRKIPDMADDYYFPSAALKFQVTNNFSFGILYDQPFGAAAEYTGNNIFVSDDTNTILAPATLAALGQQRIQTEVANNLPAALDANLQAGIDGVVAQQVQAQLTANGLPQAAAPQVEAAIRANEAAMGQIEAGVTQAITNQVTDVVTQQVTAGLDAVNGSLGKGQTKVEVDTQNLTFLFGFQPNENWNVYAGPVYQTVKGKLSLRGQAYSLYNGYDADIKETGELGWIAGFAYQIPEIALKASLTYRSKVEHDVYAKETLSAAAGLGLVGIDPSSILNASGQTEITTPQSVNLDFQTGIMANTVAFANVRWVEWSDFSIQPYKFGLVSEAVGGLIGRPDGFNLVEYDKDQWSVTAGVGRKFTEQWAGNVSVGWDSGAGNPVSTLGPTEGYWNLGLGLQFSPTPATFIGGGVKYFWLGDAKAQTGAQAGGSDYVANFEDNDAWGFGLKMGYRF